MSSPGPKVIVVMPAYNAAKTLRQTYDIAEIPVMARYFKGASSVNFRVSLIYGIKTCMLC